MSRWISADYIKALMKNDRLMQGNAEYKLWEQEVEKKVDAMPTIDIVRCEECKRRYRSGYRGDEYWVCDFMDAKIKDDDFCSYGERDGDKTDNIQTSE